MKKQKHMSMTSNISVTLTARCSDTRCARTVMLLGEGLCVIYAVFCVLAAVSRISSGENLYHSRVCVFMNRSIVHIGITVYPKTPQTFTYHGLNSRVVLCLEYIYTYTRKRYLAFELNSSKSKP